MTLLNYVLILFVYFYLEEDLNKIYIEIVSSSCYERNENVKIKHLHIFIPFIATRRNDLCIFYLLGHVRIFISIFLVYILCIYLLFIDT